MTVLLLLLLLLRIALSYTTWCVCCQCPQCYPGTAFSVSRLVFLTSFLHVVSSQIIN